jgi:hypothetical protein
LSSATARCSIRRSRTGFVDIAHFSLPCCCTDTSEIYDLNLATGQSKLWSRLTPADKTAMISLRHPIITQDGAHVLYVVQRIFSTPIKSLMSEK